MRSRSSESFLPCRKSRFIIARKTARGPPLIVSQVKADSWRFESARERYNLLLETHPEIIKRAPLAYIASYLLMTPETLSRVRSGVL